MEKCENCPCDVCLGRPIFCQWVREGLTEKYAHICNVSALAAANPANPVVEAAPMLMITPPPGQIVPPPAKTGGCGGCGGTKKMTPEQIAATKLVLEKKRELLNSPENLARRDAIRKKFNQ
jgi:hypothetical protein